MARQVNVTPVVRKSAAQRGVNLANLQGSGAGGRITVADITAASQAANPHTDAMVYAALPGASPTSRATPRGSAFVGQVTVQVDDYSPNPLVDDLRQALPNVYAMATREGPVPTLFETGDGPMFTTSGIDPAMLMKLPWCVRHAAARADRAQAQIMFERYASRSDAADAAAMASINFGHDQGNSDYFMRVTSWASGMGARALKV